MSSVLRDDYCKLLGDNDMLSDVCINNEENRWPNGIIPFVFDDALTPTLRNWLIEANAIISSVSSLEFVVKTHQKDYIKFVDENKFYSYVGRQGGEQVRDLLIIILRRIICHLSLLFYPDIIKKLSVTNDTDKWPYPIGSSMHELMHVAGIFHEHCRPDRDKYVIVEGTGSNYEKLEESNVVSFGPYDPDSIMHYSKEQGVTLKPGINTEIGQRIKLSEGDIKALNGLYPQEKTLRSRKDVLERELERLRNLPVGYEGLEKEFYILEERIKLCENKLMNLPQTSGHSM